MKTTLTKQHTLHRRLGHAALLVVLLYAARGGAQLLQLDGVNDLVNVPNSASLTVVGRLTVEAWVNRAAVGAQHSVVEKFGPPTVASAATTCASPPPIKSNSRCATTAHAPSPSPGPRASRPECGRTWPVIGTAP